MRFFAPHLLPGETAISSVAEYQQIRTKYVNACAAWLRFFPGDTLGIQPETQQAAGAKSRLLAEFRHRRLPYVLIAICPFCNAEIWQRAMVFSLEDEFWYRLYGDGCEEIFEPERCSHLFCIDGALNLNGCQPSEARGSTESAFTQKYHIRMAAEVPFVKPRVLQIPGMVAVIHRLPVADQYAAYPIAYFAEKRPPRFHDTNFCVPWAREYYIEHYEGYNFSGWRSDVQEYDLIPWLDKGQVFWLDENEGTLVNGPVQDFPFANIPGRRHPYRIESGQVYDLPNPKEGEVRTEIEVYR